MDVPTRCFGGGGESVSVESDPVAFETEPAARPPRTELGFTAVAAVAAGSSKGPTTAVSAATTGCVDACTSVSSDRPGGCLELEHEALKKPKEMKEPHAFCCCLEFGLEALKRPKELREPYSSCPDILLFA